MLRLLLLFLSSAVLFGCATSHRSERVFSKKLVRQIEASPVFAQSFTGFALADAETGKILATSNADKYFTPASNTKILTLYTCLRVLGDSLPGVIWEPRGKHTVNITPIGDPTFLHPKFQAWQHIFKDLAAIPEETRIFINGWNKGVLRFGEGWAWDDAGHYYSAERTFFPMYGNGMKLFAIAPDSLEIEPSFWKNNLHWHEYGFWGDNEGVPYLHFEDNVIAYSNWQKIAPDFEVYLPVHKMEEYSERLLEDTLHHKVSWGADDEPMPPANPTVRFSCPTDTVLRRMMYQSDNFIAEQLLLVCAGVKSGVLSEKYMIEWVQDSLLIGLKQPPKWVDGSGLSRYNLNTPYNNVEILRRLWREQPRERLFSLFPAGGAADTTLAEWFAPKPGERPYVFAKSGSMSGVYCLSGYVVGRSGRVLAFSFMHNNFVGSNRAWKAETQRFLAQIRERT